VRAFRVRDVLLDTGPIVATLDASDQWHRSCADAVTELIERCVTTEAVVTEACHMVGRGRARASLVLDFLLDADVPILSLDRPALRHAARLMDRYASVPMDFADAALVTLADALHRTDADSARTAPPTERPSESTLRRSRSLDRTQQEGARTVCRRAFFMRPFQPCGTTVKRPWHAP
jgi:predicted nucleic acid-binding protein